MQNYIKGRTSLVVAASMEDLRTRNLAETARVDIAKYDYLFQCETAEKVMALRPTHLLNKSPETQDNFANAFDEHGDAYYEEVTAAQLKEILDDIKKDVAATVPERLVETMARHPRFGLCDPTPEHLASREMPCD